MTGETPPAAKGVTEALRECLAYIQSPVRMSADEAEAARRSAIVQRALAALSTPSSGGLAVKALELARGRLDALDGYPYAVPAGLNKDIIEYIDAALSSLDRTTLPTAEGWQTMDGAPKDGSKFLAYEKGRYFDCWWHENAHGEAYWMDEADSEPDDEPSEFHIRVNGGEEMRFTARTGVYSHAVMEAFGALGLPYPCTVEIWVPDLVEAGYGPYFYRIDDFVDNRGNVYGCPSVMHISARPNPPSEGETR